MVWPSAMVPPSLVRECDAAWRQLPLSGTNKRLKNGMTQWRLPERIGTSAGEVAAGQAGEGPPLVLAHGWPWSSYAWSRLIPALSRRYRVYWYDMPGYGQSGMRPGQRTSLDVQGDVFAEMLDHWGLERPAVLAHDFGGAVTLRAHLLAGRDYAAYVLMNVVAMRPWGSAFFDHVGRHVEAFTGLPPHIHEAVVRAYIGGALVTPLDPQDVEALVSPWLSEAGRASFYSQFAQADERYTAEIEDRFADVRCPAAILWGREDPWIPLERGKALAERVRPRHFVELPGLGHLPQLEDAQAVLQAVLSVLDDLLVRSG
ncbi:alpha/beta fold hydrolase [Novosphingobium beihaiensis]|uniref:Alpha/beta hydrolase n=1 Tax=Novosphingobium beihaiensis TaxID=2930389 RepID=A0ABT0BLZ2_9SPHN|nr:alpha/beta hydrolase [Novosphingobium beihaiensis]MCJ2186081.1 alpha/beta hydrolase [Novosphingobium beihaiensis]